MSSPRRTVLLLFVPVVLFAPACGGEAQPEGSSGANGGGDGSATASGGETSGGSSGSASGTSGSSGSGSSTSDGSSSSSGSGSSTSGSSSSGSGSSSDSAGFIQPPDGGVTGQCDPAAQDCPEEEKCTPYAMTPGPGQSVDADKCVPIIGHGQEFDDCTRMEDNDDCDKGFFCIAKTSGDIGPGVCKKLCNVNETGACGDGTCVSWNDGVNPTCEYKCDPLLQDCESDREGCYPSQGDFICHPIGIPEDGGKDGDACRVVQSCNPGLICVAGTSLADCADSACCTPLCDISTDMGLCLAPEECVPFYAAGEAPPGRENVGSCAVPA